MKYIFLVALLFLLVIGMPVAYGIGISAFIGMLFSGGIRWNQFASASVGGINSTTLLAIPLFLLAGKIMNTGGITARLFKFAKSIGGWMPGGLGHVNVISSVIFAGMSGSAVADAGGIGAIELKAMREDGYDDDFSCAVTATSSTIGPMIPPSVPLIIYGTVSGASVGALFMAGIIPGLIMALIMMIVVFIFAIVKKYPRTPFAGFKQMCKDFVPAILPLITVAIVLVGIYSGVFTATEASVVVVFYSIFLSMVVYKELTPKGLYGILLETLNDAASIGLIVAFSSLFGKILIQSMIPQQIAEAMSGSISNKIMFILILNVFLLIVGMFMDATAAITILVPILLPLTTAWGISPVHFGIIFVLNMGIGALTPPFGILIFVMSKVSGLDAGRLVRAYIPWIIAMLVALVIVSFVPLLSTYLPQNAGYSIY